MAKKSFTMQQFLALIGKSPVVKAMSPADVYVLMQMAADPNSEHSQKIYEILLEEQKRIEHMGKKFSEIATKVMDEMQMGFFKVKTNAKKEKLKGVGKELTEEEDKKADELLTMLKTLNQK